MYRLGFDCETAPVTPGKQAPELACFAIGADDDITCFHFSDLEDVLEPLLRDPQVTFTGHNIAFDFMVAAAKLPHLFPHIFRAYEQDRILDTGIRQKLCDIAGGVYRGFEDIEGKTEKLNYSLEDLAYRHLGRELDKNTWRLRYGELIPVPFHMWPQGAKDYVIEDVRAGNDVCAFQDRNVFYLEDQYRQTRAALWLKLMSAWGIRTDEVGVKALAAKTERTYSGIAADLRALGLLRPDKVKRDGTTKPGSRDTKLAQARIVKAYARQNKEHPLTESGAPCLDKLACEESLDPVLVKYSELTSLKTVLSKDIPALSLGIFFPIHSWFEELLETGRTSSKKPNIQNLRRLPGIRECFVPRFGCAFVESDYGSVELCTLAQACLTVLGRSALADAINSGLDPHLAVAAQILKAPYEVLDQIRKGLLKEWNGIDYHKVDDARQTGKVANFGFPGGLGAEALVFFAKSTYNVDLTVDEARALKRTWLASWPEMTDYFAWIDSHTGGSGFPAIQQLFSNRVRGGVTFPQACNTIFQGLAADIAKEAGWAIAKACYVDTESPLFGWRIVNFIHDAFLIEGPIARTHEAGLELSRLMLIAAKKWLPDIKTKTETVAMMRYSKDAKVAKDSNGRLIPWVPKAA